MPARKNKATNQDQTLQDAFKQGFEEGVRQAQGAELIYEFVATFEGTDLRRVQFSDLDDALAEARQLLLNGHGTSVSITCVAVPTQQEDEPKAVAQARVIPEDETADDAEVVQDPSEG